MTKDQALSCHEFHFVGCTRTVGKRGGITTKIETWRRSGKTQTWKTRDDFKIPIKRGLYEHGYITESNVQHFHSTDSCSALGE